MKKKINKYELAKILALARLALGTAAYKFLYDLEEDENGVEIDLGEVVQAAKALWDGPLLDKVEEMLKGELPEVEVEEPVEPTDPEEPTGPPEPVDDLHGYKYMTKIDHDGKIMHHRDGNGQTVQDLFEVPGCGREYGGRILLEWEDGYLLQVPNAGSRHYPNGSKTDKRKWQPGCGDGSTPGCEAYAKVGSHPKWMKIYHDKKPSGVPVEPEEPDTSTDIPGWKFKKYLPWQGDPNQVPMPNSAQGQYMGFSRVWYSCTDHPCRTIVRQVEIPDGVLPDRGQAYFVFDDGIHAILQDCSARTEYLKVVKGSGRGIKFVKGQPNHPYVHDRLDDIAFAEGSACTGVKIYLKN